MSDQYKIRQQEASVALARTLLKAGRIKPHELEIEERKLADMLKEAEAPAPSWNRPVAPPVAEKKDSYPQGPSELGNYLSSLAKEIRAKQNELAEISNTLHLIPPSENCASVVSLILGKKADIEAMWDRYYYAKRNGQLPAEAPKPNATDNSVEKYEIAAERQRTREKISKLKKKIGEPKASVAKVQAWREELAAAELHLQDLNEQLSLL